MTAQGRHGVVVAEDLEPPSGGGTLVLAALSAPRCGIGDHNGCVRRVLAAAFGCILLVACSSAVDVTTDTTPAVPGSANPNAAHFTVESLGVSFDLPRSFESATAADLVFLAKSTAPQALFTIDRASAGIVDHAARAGETLTSMKFDGHKAVVVSHAAVEGLPSGISSTELLVANGSESFSVIMSAATADVDALWQVFVASVSIAAT